MHTAALASDALEPRRASPPTLDLEMLDRRAFLTVAGGALLASAWPLRDAVPSGGTAKVSSHAAATVAPPGVDLRRPRSANRGKTKRLRPRLRAITGYSRDLLRAFTARSRTGPNLSRGWLGIATHNLGASGEGAAAMVVSALGHPGLAARREGAARALRLTSVARRVVARARRLPPPSGDGRG